MIGETEGAHVQEDVILEKFEGEPTPENLFERIHIRDGEIISITSIRNGEVVSVETVKEVE